MDNLIRLMMIDDHKLVREGFSALLAQEDDIELVGTGENGTEGMRLLGIFQIDVALVDIDMPEMNGIEFTTKAKSDYPDLKIIILTMHEEPAMMQELISLGADGYLLKTTDREELSFAIKKVANGKKYYSDELTAALNSPGLKVSTPGEVSLSDREKEILEFVAEGLSNKEIGSKLNISHRTVDTHRNNLMKKLDIHNVAGLVRYAFKHGIIE
ncbi:MAG: response regulator transcription factor [Flavobacteriales bacterium]|nr:response regulator transcription factor [Flavobacteriales bacterium]